MTATGQSITRDPVYTVTAAFFAVLTTALPALLGQPRFLPILQALTLTVFIVLPLHHRHPRGALHILAIWLPLQFLTLAVLTMLLRAQVENAIPNGFVLRGEIAAWFFGGAPYPTVYGVSLGARLGEIALLVIGSLATAGLVGTLVLMRILNLAAYSTGVLLAALETPGLLLLTVPWWTLLRVAGYGGLVALLAEPLITYTWSPGHYWRSRRRHILIALGLVLAGIILELLLPGFFARPPRP